MRLFGSDNIASIMDKLGMGEDDPIEHKLITRSLESAQKKVEARNFDIRKHVLEYDDVMNQQREVIYGQRRQVLTGENLRENIMNMVAQIIDGQMDQYANAKLYPEEWTLDGLIEDAEKTYAPQGKLVKAELEAMSRDELAEHLRAVAENGYKDREMLFGEANMRELEKVVMLKVVDGKWMEHLARMDMLREGINLRAYGQKNPLVEYKIEAYDMFQEMIEIIQEDIAKLMYRVSIVTQEQQQLEDHLKNAKAVHGSDEPEVTKAQPVVKKDDVGRNDPCPCGSGKKYKNCCGKNK